MARRMAIRNSLLRNHQRHTHRTRPHHQPRPELWLDLSDPRRHHQHGKKHRVGSYARSHLVETIFLVPYLWTLYTYNYPHWARGSFARFAIPIVPFALLALYQWIPKDRRILWGLAVVSSILAAASAIGIANVAQVLRRAL